MGPVTMIALIAGGAFLASLTFDVGLNVAQDWYSTMYNDAAWSTRVNSGNSPVMRKLAREEEAIDKLLTSDDAAPQPPHR